MKLIRNDFICTECGNIFCFQGSETHLKKLYFSKKIWCYECKKKTISINLADSSLWKMHMENKKNKTVLEKELLELIDKHEGYGLSKKVLQR